MRCEQRCPETAELVRLLNEACGPRDEEALAAHLGRCVGCRRRLEVLAGDTPVPGLCHLAPRPDLMPGGPLHRAIELLKAEAPAWGEAPAGGPGEVAPWDVNPPADRPELPRLPAPAVAPAPARTRPSRPPGTGM